MYYNCRFCGCSFDVRGTVLPDNVADCVCPHCADARRERGMVTCDAVVRKVGREHFSAPPDKVTLRVWFEGSSLKRGDMVEIRWYDAEKERVVAVAELDARVAALERAQKGD